MELVADRTTRAKFPASVKPGKMIEREARARGLLFRCGNDYAAFAPPLIVTAEQIDEMVGILGDSIAAAEKQLLKPAR